MKKLGHYIYQFIRFNNLFILGTLLLILCVIIIILSSIAIGIQHLISWI
jgi:hypothetical protein